MSKGQHWRYLAEFIETVYLFLLECIFNFIDLT